MNVCELFKLSPFLSVVLVAIIYLNVKCEEDILKFAMNILVFSAYLKRGKINDNEG